MLPILLAQFIFAGALAAQPFLNFHVQYHGHYSGWTQAWSSDGDVALQFTSSWNPDSQLTISSPDSATVTGEFQWNYNNLMAADPWNPANWSMTHNGSPVGIGHVDVWGGKDYNEIHYIDTSWLHGQPLGSDTRMLSFQLYGNIHGMDPSLAQNFDIQLWDGSQTHWLSASLNGDRLEIDLSGISLAEGAQYGLNINYHSHAEMVVRGYADDGSMLFDGVIMNDAGFGQYVDFTVTAPTAVPEPATYAALAATVILMASIWHRRRQRP